ncbi:hypothetical protein L249_7010 [Ophiocordyceps polyrhachis-furcata BCC 54312]|uniref:Heat-labile enterotoxin n=1 Tax=Ophiocordyceps polyrhachis-furcata BCC 54312 TaxID=1330021 RepID=A0A367LK28_9HYPO|nr:hypothetical protein L249_7010 [Ophiocordyceps polyrhachis-furcata BCC 54312]
MKMLRVSPAILLLLLCLLASVRTASSDGGQGPPEVEAADIIYVFIWDPRPPGQIRADGGWRPPNQDYEDNMRAFFVYHHELGQWDDEGRPREARWATAYVTAYVNMADAQGGRQEGWLYRIRVSRNMVMCVDNDPSRVYALGGIQWAQVRSYRLATSTIFILIRRDHNFARYVQDSITVLPSTCSLFIRDPGMWDCWYASDFAHLLLSHPLLGPRLGYLGFFPLCFERFNNETTARPGSNVPECQPGPSGSRNRGRPGRQNLTGTSAMLNEHSHSSGSRENCEAAAPRAACCDPEQERVDEEWIDKYLDSVVLRSSLDHNEAGQAEQLDEADQAEQLDAEEPAEDEERPRKKQKPNNDTVLPYETTTPNPLEQPGTSGLSINDVDWRALAAFAALCEMASGGSHQKRSAYEFHNKKACDDAANKIRKLDSCERITGLEVGVTLSNDYWSGTSSEISLAFDGSQGPVRIPIADGPSRGFNTWKSFGLNDHGISELKDVKNIRLETREKSSFPWFSTAWRLQDVELRGRCVETNDLVVMEKYKSLNQWFETPNKDITTWQSVGNLAVTTPDWKVKPPCNYLSSLTVNFTIGDRNWAGTGHTITFSVNSMSKPIIIAKAPSRGTFVSKKLDLADVVQVRDLNKMSLLDQTSRDWSLTAGWFLKGVTLSGECVASRKRISMNKFKAVNEWFEHQNPIEQLEPVWGGEFSPEDWSL